MLGYTPTIPEPPAGEWDWVGATIVLGALILIALFYLIHSGARAPR